MSGGTAYIYPNDAGLTKDFGDLRAVDEIAVVAEAMNHHPDLDIRWRTLRVVLSTHDAGGVTQLDIEMAHRIHEIAAGHGAQ